MRYRLYAKSGRLFGDVEIQPPAPPLLRLGRDLYLRDGMDFHQVEPLKIEASDVNQARQEAS